MTLNEKTEEPNPADFSVNERPREYDVRFVVKGVIGMKVEADILEDAQSIAEKYLEDDDFGSDLDEVTEIKVAQVLKSPKMYRVLRGGIAMQSNRLASGDLPREPDEGGF